MDTNNYSFPWLELIDCPAFCVKDGTIIAANTTAEQRMLRVGTDVREIITENRDVYETFENGSLYLNIRVFDLPCPACVTRTQECDIFHLHQDGNESILQALALASVQLRTPLNNIMAVTDRLFPNLAQADEGLQEEIGQINQNLYRMLRVICNMSDAASYQKSGISGMQVTDLASVIDEIMEKAQVLFAGSHISLEYTGLNAPVFGLANTEKLERAIHNILSNAANFSLSGSTVSAALRKSGNTLTFTVQNKTAENISDNNFWQRYRREPGIEDPRHGLGLGMTLASAVASLHRGTVLVDRPAVGETRVTMSIPIVKEDSDNLRSPILRIGDYAGGRDRLLLELAEVLPSDAYQNIN
ncbi:MAG: HAMP domain-containing histidine kinase [Oscillospiraceae bacterium]|nr:HAMP domain-containing histidine kinase [Oscillospiraceae bacterium]MBQ8748201.1 HAMP domain-containing histidine kinase [Oscillospiraceae bacterium]MBQ8881456.1 HAMP domain-containing histidine kinase [Oscillospiraceae bacterium]